MRRLLLLVVLAFVVFITVFRQRLFLRDPIASVERNHVAVEGAIVMINYANDVLLYDRSGGHNRIYLVQNWNLVPSVPGELKCLAFMACLADADHVTAAPIPGNRQPAVMTNKRAEFLDEDRAKISVTLR